MGWSLGGAKHPPTLSLQTKLQFLAFPHSVCTTQRPVSIPAYDLGTSQNTYGFPKTLTVLPFSPKILTTPLPPFLLKSW